MFPPIFVILAAGGSTRMGRPKSMLQIAPGRTLLESHIAAARDQCAAVVVVEGASPLGALPPGVYRATNADWATTGPFDSLQRALARVAGLPGPLIVTPVDVPPVRSADLTRLIQRAPGAEAAVLAWGGQTGHPAWLSPALRKKLTGQPSPPDGLRGVMTGARRVPASTPDVLLNLNTPEQWRAWRRAQGDQGETV